ncbi:hypothetical protein [Rhodomicrobium sp.]|uniref:hypothetical protein n=1 Tax=Rhodomicrobium sp. TaxID=2720632 RepID=UPI0039E2C923
MKTREELEEENEQLRNASHAIYEKGFNGAKERLDKEIARLKDAFDAAQRVSNARIHNLERRLKYIRKMTNFENR